MVHLDQCSNDFAVHIWNNVLMVLWFLIFLKTKMLSVPHCALLAATYPDALNACLLLPVPPSFLFFKCIVLSKVE